MKNIFNKILAFSGGIIILFLVILVIQINNVNKNLNSKISKLETNIASLNNSILLINSSFSSQISQLKNQFEESKRIYYNNGFEIINYNSDDDIVTINYYLNLKTYGSSDKVFLVYKNSSDINKVEMLDNNSIFNIYIDIESNKLYELSVVVEGERIETQWINNIHIYDYLKNRIYISPPAITSITYDGNDKYNTAIMSSSFSNNYGNNDNLKIISGKITASINNQTILENENISSLIKDYDNSQSFYIEKEFQFSNNSKPDYLKEETLTFTIELKDTYGFTYYWSSPLK